MIFLSLLLVVLAPLLTAAQTRNVNMFVTFRQNSQDLIIRARFKTIEDPRKELVSCAIEWEEASDAVQESVSLRNIPDVSVLVARRHRALTRYFQKGTCDNGYEARVTKFTNPEDFEIEISKAFRSRYGAIYPSLPIATPLIAESLKPFWFNQIHCDGGCQRENVMLSVRRTFLRGCSNRSCVGRVQRAAHQSRFYLQQLT